MNRTGEMRARFRRKSILLNQQVVSHMSVRLFAMPVIFGRSLFTSFSMRTASNAQKSHFRECVVLKETKSIYILATFGYRNKST